MLSGRVSIEELLLNFTILRYGRFWAVYEDEELLCVTVYRKGAQAVIDRIRNAHQKGEGPQKIPKVPASIADRQRKPLAKRGA